MVDQVYQVGLSVISGMVNQVYKDLYGYTGK